MQTQEPTETTGELSIAQWLERYRGILFFALILVAAVGVVFFQVLVDGWLTKLSAPIVIYDPDQMTGLRFPWDIPVEDYLFGYSMVTLTIMLWVRWGRRHEEVAGDRP